MRKWWATVGKLGTSPIEWKGSPLFRLHSKGKHNDPVNYRAITLIPHKRKIINTAILSYVCDAFTLAGSQFWFQPNVSVQQALLQAQSNAQQGLIHTVVLVLANAYDKVDRGKRLQIIAEWVDWDKLNMIRVTFGTPSARTKTDPAEFHTDIARGVPQGAPSSPI